MSNLNILLNNELRLHNRQVILGVIERHVTLNKFIVPENVFREMSFHFHGSLLAAAILDDVEFLFLKIVLEELNRSFVYHQSLFVLKLLIFMSDDSSGY